VTDKSEATVAKANLVEHLKNIGAACDDARLSAVEKIRGIKGGRKGAGVPKAPVVVTEVPRRSRNRTHIDIGGALGHPASRPFCSASSRHWSAMSKNICEQRDLRRPRQAVGTQSPFYGIPRRGRSAPRCWVASRIRPLPPQCGPGRCGDCSRVISRAPCQTSISRPSRNFLAWMIASSSEEHSISVGGPATLLSLSNV
jgi:hypothetical protein